MTRNDGFANILFGQGFKQRDPFASYRYKTNGALSDYREADNLFTKNGIFRRVIKIPAEEALRAGFEIKIGETEMDDTTKRRLFSTIEDIALIGRLTLALTWDRLFGGAIVLIVCDDGNALDEPLNLASLKRIERLDIFSPEDVSFTNNMLYSDPTDKHYGEPQYYNIVGLWGNSFSVHESRLLLFRGGEISNHYRRMRQGWGASVFERVREELLHYSSGLDLAFMALGRLSQGILKLTGMSSLLMNDEGEKAVLQRLQIIDMARHMMNTLALDKEDEYDLKNMSLAGVEKILQQFQYALCAATGIPATKLFGRAPAGENATGESDLENYYNMVEAIQQNTLKKPLSRLIDIISRCSEYKITLPNEWDIQFNSLWSESEREKSERETLNADAQRQKADTAKIYHELGALDAKEIRATLERDGDFDIDRSLDDVLSAPTEE